MIRLNHFLPTIYRLLCRKHLDYRPTVCCKQKNITKNQYATNTQSILGYNLRMLHTSEAYYGRKMINLSTFFHSLSIFFCRFVTTAEAIHNNYNESLTMEEFKEIVVKLIC